MTFLKKLYDALLTYVVIFLKKDTYVVIFLKKDTDITQFKKQPSRGVLRKRYSENMKQIYRRTPMPRVQ